MRWSEAKRAGVKRYHGRICPFHEELNGLRRTHNSQCVGCHADRAWYVSVKWHQELHEKLKELTPEAPDEATATAGKEVPRMTVTAEALDAMGRRYAVPPGAAIDAVCLGTPHYSRNELKSLVAMLRDHDQPLRRPVYVTTARDLLADSDLRECRRELRSRGVVLLTDTCSYYGTVIPGLSGTVMTDSAKWAWYAAGNLGVQPVLASLERCVTSAVAGRLADRSHPPGEDA